MRRVLFALAVSVLAPLSLISAQSCGSSSHSVSGSATAVEVEPILPGAVSVDEYIPLIEGKKVCILSNQTGMIDDNTHILDTMLSLGINVVSILSPEHGFRGTADAGELVSSSVDEKTGVPVRSLYDGKGGYPSQETIDEFDVLVFDLQDVGCRFYTYLTTMTKMMAVCAQNGKKMIILDRPNPLGFYVDGPILDMQYKSGVGYLPIPVVHGMTLGELSGMINGEKWLPDGIQCDVTVIKCRNYTHHSKYVLPVKPSPNLPDMRSIYLYPSMCYFEATPVSLGRGTDKAFQMYGHPNMIGYSYSFTPRSIAGAKNPPQLDKKCFGVDLRTKPTIDEINAAGINLEYVIDAYTNLNLGSHFFRSFFELLIGRDYVRKMIMDGATAAEIEARWVDDVTAFKAQRKPYLLYAE
ncbi:MAG: DUF1343 domain-containing protein [Bacteroidales bacterium]|nr:DUF1343 domain-containing protein [Bacteroidales bacterium]MDD3201316.1 DUF1343 domain-containing protein [Bacteroidales bacterium]